jgi:hypothetical protein
MNSSCFISHHLFVSAAGHENRARVKSTRQPREVAANSRRRRPGLAGAAANELEGPRQMELLAELATAG